MKLGSKKQGNLFEQFFYKSATQQGFGVMRWPDGCRSAGKKIIRVQTPADFLVMYRGQAALIDTKSQGTGKTFPKQNINMNQVFSISYLVSHGAKGGYVVYFRDINKVVFFDTEQLRLAEAGLHYETGLLLGTIEEFNLGLIYGTI